VLIVAVLLTSCESFLINDDPNNPTAVTPDLMPVAQKIYRKPNSRNWVEVEELTVLETWWCTTGVNLMDSWYPDEFAYLAFFYQGIFNDSYTQSFKAISITYPIRR
jgi:hypothetical protein